MGMPTTWHRGSQQAGGGQGWDSELLCCLQVQARKVVRGHWGSMAKGICSLNYLEEFDIPTDLIDP